MKHLHVLKTAEVEFRIITNSLEFCWNNFLDGVPVEAEIYKITTITKLPNGKRLCKIFSAV
jgi:hypothetical protein